MDEFDSLEKKDMQHWRALMRAKLESGASFSFVWLTILINEIKLKIEIIHKIWTSEESKRMRCAESIRSSKLLSEVAL